MEVFLGSSREASETGLLRRVAGWIEAAGHRPLRWDEPGVFPVGAYTFSTLRQLAQRVEAAIFIFSEDDEVWYRTDKATQPRDNILIEYGLFSAALGEGRVIICRSGQPRTATDLLGITCINVSASTIVRAEIEITDWLRRLQAPDPGSLVLEQLTSPFQASGKRSLFLKGTELVRRARSRVALVAKTPIILLGPRPYDGASSPISYEAEQLATYQDLINQSCTQGTPDFICVASRACVLDELREYKHTELPRRVRENYKQLHACVKGVRLSSGMRLHWHEGAAPMTFLVSDDDFMIWFKDGSGESVWITAHNEVIARALYSNAEAIGEDRAVDEVLHDFAELC